MPELDDLAAIEAADPGEMLRQVASSAAQVRQARLATAEAGIDAIAQDVRPRAVVITGMGGSGIAGDVLAGLCGDTSPVPIVTVRGYQLPGWVGPADLVIAVSCSGSTEETISVTTEAVRRGCRLLAVGNPDSPLASIAKQANAPLVPVTSAGQPRATLWGLSIPVVLAARALGLVDLPEEELEATATRLEDVAHRCRPASESFLNPGKQLALELRGSVPMIWGTSPLTAVAAYRFACQLNENAKYVATYGALPEANHNQVVAFDGYFGTAAQRDFFADRVDEAEPAGGLRLVVLRDSAEHPQVAKRRTASADLAQARGIPVTELAADGAHPLVRFASLVGLIDYASVYLALALDTDPTPVNTITELKMRIAP